MRPARIFYGWWVALAFSVIVFLSTGIRFAIGPFLKPMVADLGLDRASYSLVVSLGLFLYGLFMPLIGTLAEWVGVRVVAAAGVVVFALSVSATGLVANLWQLTLVQGVLGAAGLAATGHVVGSAVISRWFVRRRATALSLLGAAAMAGMSLIVPVAMWLILTVGWRHTYALLGLVVLVVLLPIGLWVVRESPESMGLHPDGLPPDARGLVTAAVEKTDMRAAVRALPFWQLAGALFTCGFSMSASSSPRSSWSTTVRAGSW